ncbi:MAG: GTP-binding protein [Candidatus Hodarchaeales archaeon]|jgi:small GTP-binding protein
MEEYIYKIVILGEKATGKSSIIRRYVHDTFEGRYTGTIGLNVSNKVLESGDLVTSLLIYDIEAEADFEDLFEPFAKGTSGALFVFDVTRPETFSAIENWINRLKSVSKSTVLENSALIGNKVDLSREVSEDLGKNLAEQLSMFDYFETSAKENTGVDQAFHLLAKRIHQANLKKE